MEPKTILKIIPALQATSLVVKNIPKFGMKPVKKMGIKKQTKNLVKNGMETLIGIGILGATSSAINDL